MRRLPFHALCSACFICSALSFLLDVVLQFISPELGVELPEQAYGELPI